MHAKYFCLVFLLGLYFHVTSVTCSVGDRSLPFKKCMRACHYIPEQFELSPPLFWNTSDECKYQCMWVVEKHRRDSGMRPQKYFGKWPFERVFLFQEFFSSLFSLFNIVPHLFFLLVVGKQIMKRKAMASEIPPTRGTSANIKRFEAFVLSSAKLRKLEWFVSLWKLYAYISINAWVWSFVFHARDTYVTERLDYFSASLAIISGFAFALITAIYPKRPSKISLGIIIATLLFYTRHIFYMQFVSFDYGYNLIVVSVFSFLFTSIWMGYGLKKLPKYKSAKNFIIACMGLVFASGLEIFDFPPFFNLIDAHALWHLATPPICFALYKGLLDVSIAKSKLNSKFQ